MRGPFARLRQWAWADIKDGSNTDLWLLSVSAVIFTTLGALGIVGATALGSMVLALLAVVAISQIRTRQVLQAGVREQLAPQGVILHDEFPHSYNMLRARATTSWMFIGNSMARTFATGRPILERILRSGGRVRILLPDPDCAELIRMITESRRVNESIQQTEAFIRHTLASIVSLHHAVGGDLEVRVTDIMPKFGLNVLDEGTSAGVVMVQAYEFRATGEQGPIAVFLASDGHWYRHFIDLAGRLWDSGKSWDDASKVSLAPSGNSH